MTVGKSEMEVVGYILVGGGSTRFGRDKALVEVGGTPMLERMVELLWSVTKEVRLVAAPSKYAAVGQEKGRSAESSPRSKMQRRVLRMANGI